MVTKIRKFVFVNLIEAVKHVDLDLLNFLCTVAKNVKEENDNKTNLSVTPDEVNPAEAVANEKMLISVVKVVPFLSD